MKYLHIVSIFLMSTISAIAQKDSLQIGDRYAEDQIYLTINYAQMYNQPETITNSSFSFGFSTGFIKDIILNKSGSFSFGLGVGYGYDFFNHQLKVEELNNSTVFSSAINTTSNTYSAHNLEIPFEIRWRTSTAKDYDFWRIYAGIKLLYNLRNNFEFIENNAKFDYSNVSTYNNFQYGLTLSAGYDEFNMNLFYGLTPIFSDGTLNGNSVDTKIIKFGLIFYIL